MNLTDQEKSQIIVRLQDGQYIFDVIEDVLSERERPAEPEPEQEGEEPASEE